MSFSTLRYLGFGAAALVLIGSVYACGASSDNGSTFSTGTGGKAGAAGSAGAAGALTDASAGSSGAVSTGGSGGGQIFLDADIGDGAMNSDTACVSSHVDAVPLPLDLYFMVDQSGSMSGSPWTQESTALKSFFNDAQSAGLWVALNFFPKDTESPNCDGSLYVMPIVDWVALPAGGASLVSAINAVDPTGGTPTQDALNGVLKGAKNRQIQMSDHLVAAVIVSDGMPEASDCTQESASEMGAIADKYATGTPSIKTFAIYVDDSANDVMTAIAQKGGTGTAFDATGGTQDFINALNSIKTVALACDYKIPTTDGGKIDTSKVNVAFTPGGADAGAEQILKVADKAGCNNGPGWYYDNETNPTTISLCPSSCDQAKKD